MDTMRSLAFTGILEEGYNFADEFCEIPEDDPSSGCLLINNLAMDTGAVSPLKKQTCHVALDDTCMLTVVSVLCAAR
jgi:hypothetical protein